MSYYAHKPLTTDDLKQEDVDRAATTLFTYNPDALHTVPEAATLLIQALSEAKSAGATVTQQFGKVQIALEPSEEDLRNVLGQEQSQYERQTDYINMFTSSEREDMELYDILTTRNALEARAKVDPALKPRAQEARDEFSRRSK